MKRLLFTVITLLLLSSFAYGKDIKLYYEGREVMCDTPPVIKNDRVLVPLRAIAESMGALVTYDPKEKDIYISYGTKNIKMSADITGVTIYTEKHVNPLIKSNLKLYSVEYTTATGIKAHTTPEDIDILTGLLNKETFNWSDFIEYLNVKISTKLYFVYSHYIETKKHKNRKKENDTDEINTYSGNKETNK